MDNGKKLPAIDIYSVKNVSKNDAFEVFFKKDPIVWPLISILWSRDSTYVQDTDGSIYRFHYTDWTQSFSSDGTFTEISDGHTIVTKWYLNKTNSTISVNTITYKIETLNENKMILSWVTGPNQIKTWAVYSNKKYKS